MILCPHTYIPNFLSTIVDTVVISVIRVVLVVVRCRLRNTILGFRIVDLSVPVLTAVVGVGVAVAVAVVLVVRIVRVAVDSGTLGSVALAGVVVELVRVGMLGKLVVLVDSGCLATEQTGEEAGSLAVAGGVVVGGAGTETLLLVMVAGESYLHEDGEDKEEAVLMSDSEIGRGEMGYIHCNDGNGQASRLKSTSNTIAGKGREAITSLGCVASFTFAEWSV